MILKKKRVNLSETEFVLFFWRPADQFVRPDQQDVVFSFCARSVQGRSSMVITWKYVFPHARAIVDRRTERPSSGRTSKVSIGVSTSEWTKFTNWWDRSALQPLWYNRLRVVAFIFSFHTQMLITRFVRFTDFYCLPFVYCLFYSIFNRNKNRNDKMSNLKKNKFELWIWEKYKNKIRPNYSTWCFSSFVLVFANDGSTLSKCTPHYS